MCLIGLLALGTTKGWGRESAVSNHEQEAKELFRKVYEKVFGAQGSQLSYAVNIIGLYKTEGDIIYKNKKVQYQEKRYAAWEDGETAYMVDKKKKTVNIYKANDDRKDEYLSKFKYDVNDFDFSYQTKGEYYIITAKIRDKQFFGIREVQGTVLRKNLHPVSLMIRLSIFSTTVQISNFKSGGIDDDCFVFPHEKFKDYTFTDHRSK